MIHGLAKGLTTSQSLPSYSPTCPDDQAGTRIGDSDSRRDTSEALFLAFTLARRPATGA